MSSTGFPFIPLRAGAHGKHKGKFLSAKSFGVMNRYCLTLALMIGGLYATAQAEIDARTIAFNCRNCHGDTATSIPSLQSLSRQQIQQALLDFKYDKKPATLMPRLAKGYSDAELAAVADYLSRQ